MTREQALNYMRSSGWSEEQINTVTEALTCGDAISRQAAIDALNKMDRYVADELTLCGAERKFPKNEVFIVDDVYEEIVEQLPSVNPQEPCEDAISRTAALNTLDTMDKALDENRTVEEYKELLRECYEQLPSVRVAEKIGRWKDGE